MSALNGSKLGDQSHCRCMQAEVRADYTPNPASELQAKNRYAYDLHQFLQQPAL